MERELAWLKQQEPIYEVADNIRDALSQVTLHGFVAPTATGKSTIINMAMAIDPNFTRAVSSTTRPVRPHENKNQYHFREHNKGTIDQITDLVKYRQLVQYAVHPALDFVYWSELETFSSPHVMLDMLSSAVNNMRRIPFKKMTITSIACEPEIWEQRASKVLANKDQAAGRIAEAAQSLEWSLDQGDNILWLDNSRGSPKKVAAKFIELAQGERGSDSGARQVGERLLKFVSGL